jgi:hypothetical protein
MLWKNNSTFAPTAASESKTLMRVTMFDKDGPYPALLRNQRVVVVGTFNLGSSFFRSDGNLVISDTNYQKLFGPNSLK